jgi:hypothetical protein
MHECSKHWRKCKRDRSRRRSRGCQRCAPFLQRKPDRGGVVLVNNGQAVYAVSAGAGGIGINDASSPALAAISFGFGKVI